VLLAATRLRLVPPVLQEATGIMAASFVPQGLSVLTSAASPAPAAQQELALVWAVHLHHFAFLVLQGAT
jgi:hypothetical protein